MAEHFTACWTVGVIGYIGASLPVADNQAVSSSVLKSPDCSSDDVSSRACIPYYPRKTAADESSSGQKENAPNRRRSVIWLRGQGSILPQDDFENVGIDLCGVDEFGLVKGITKLVGED